MVSFDNHIKAYWLSCFATFKRSDLQVQTTSEHCGVNQMKWIHRLFLEGQQKENIQELPLGCFLSFMEARLDVFFVRYRPTAAGNRGDDLAFWEHHQYFLSPAVCWVFQKFSMWLPQHTFSCLLSILSFSWLVIPDRLIYFSCSLARGWCLLTNILIFFLLL